MRVLALASTAVALLWTAASLAVSHYVYDRSPLYSLEWLTLQPSVWINIHAGLDEMTDRLRQRLRTDPCAVFDIFDSEQMTEPSIARARELRASFGSQPASWRCLPADSDVGDAIFLIFAAHEFRQTEARHVFFREVARVLKPGGCMLLVEHLRDLPNFLAFGPGFLHFQSRRTWLVAFRVAGLVMSREYSVTPFVRVFEVTKEAARV
jgi:SAM-dependent methyltransferase